jgi:hypothetical protein
MTINPEKLSQIVKLLSDVRTLLDGGYHYSSPIRRRQAAERRASANGVDETYFQEILVEKKDCVSLLADVVIELDWLQANLFELAIAADELDVDTVALCGANLELQARVYEQLSQDLSRAITVAVEALRPQATKPERRKRGPNKPKSTPSTQTRLAVDLDEEPQDEPAATTKEDPQS